MTEGIVGGEAFAVDASMMVADAESIAGAASPKWKISIRRLIAQSRNIYRFSMVRGATPTEPKGISPTDPVELHGRGQQRHRVRLFRRHCV
jgi:hypothetical protein